MLLNLYEGVNGEIHDSEKNGIQILSEQWTRWSDIKLHLNEFRHKNKLYVNNDGCHGIWQIILNLTYNLHI